MQTFDVAVVGGGLIGRMIAYELARENYRVAAIYPHAQFHGMASAAAGAMLGVFSETSAYEPQARREATAAYRWQARQLYDAWLSELRARSGLPIHVSDGLVVIANAAGAQDLKALQAIRDAAHTLQRPAQTFGASDIAGLAPHPNHRILDAVYLPDEGSVDTLQILAALESCLRQMPNCVCANDAAQEIVLEANSVKVQLRSGDALHAAQVVLANGVEIPRLLQASHLTELGVPPIFSGRGVSVLARGNFNLPYTIRTPNRGFACGLHLVPRANGAMYIGATNRFSTTPDTARHPTADELTNVLSGATHQINTALADAEITALQIGHRPVTLDRIPVVGRTGDARILLATGTYRNGVLLAPLLAQLIAQEIAQPGVHQNHAFNPLRDVRASAGETQAQWLRRASESLVESLVEPGGFLPDHRAQDLSKFFHVVLSALLDEDADRALLHQKIQRLLQRAPVEENMPLLFDVIARESDKLAREG